MHSHERLLLQVVFAFRTTVKPFMLVWNCRVWISIDVLQTRISISSDTHCGHMHLS